VVSATQLEWQLRREHELVIGKELIEAVVSKSVEVITRAQSEVVKLRQVINQPRNGIEACEVELLELAILEELLLETELAE